jgi:hypothetical protein
MKKQIGSFIVAIMLLTAVSALAQTPNSVKVKVPFPFVTAGKSWPAGDYRVDIATEKSTLTLSSPGIAPAMILTMSDERFGNTQTYLQFQCSGDRWVLQEVTLNGLTQILPSAESAKELANLKPTCQSTSIAAVRASN